MDVITLLLSSYPSSLDTWIIPKWKPNITHKHSSMTCEIPKSLIGTVNSTLPLARKVVILIKIKQTKEWGGDPMKTCSTWQIENNDVG